MLPFVLVFVMLTGYVELLYAILTNAKVVDAYGETIYYLPISNLLGLIFFCDWLDVLLLFIISTALECCYRNHLAVALLGLNLVVRYIFENITLQENILIYISATMAVLCALAVIGGITMIGKRNGK